jgi:hypothetical protein
MKRMRGQIVRREFRLPRVRRRRLAFVDVIDRAVFRQQFRRAIALVVRMGKAVVDQKGFRVLRRLALREVIHHPIAVPFAAGFSRAPALGRIVAHGEELVRGLIAVAHLTRPHRRIAGSVEDCGQRLLLQFRRAQPLLQRQRRCRQMPHRAPTHDHVPRRRADRTHVRAHVIRAVENHALAGEPVEVRRFQRRLGVVALQVERRLVIDEDEQNVRSLGRGRSGERWQRQRDQGDGADEDVAGDRHTERADAVFVGEGGGVLRSRG